MKAVVILLAAVILSGCATYHQPRYGADGVYFDQWHAAPRQVVVVDPMIYPFWSLDFFYFGHFHRPYRPLFFYHDPWFFHDPWFHPRHRWATSVVWAHPVVYQSPRPDQRLFLMQEARTPVRPTRVASRGDSALIPGSEVQLRHRLAEDRAAAAARPRPAEHRGAADRTVGGRATGLPTERSERLRQTTPRQTPEQRTTAPRERAPEPRPPAQRPAPPPRQSEPAPRAPATVRSPRDRQIDR